MWGGTANGTRLWLWDCHGGDGQIFVPYGGYGVLDVKSGRCIDKDGTPLILYDCRQYSDQIWTMPSVTGPMTSPAAVTNGAWHHVVLSASNVEQKLFLDGVPVASMSGGALQHRAADIAYIGTGKLTRGWPGGPTATSGNLG
jgi:hypothetical protein